MPATAVRWGYDNAAKTSQEQANRKIVILGVVNAKARKFPQPKYPVAAKAAAISGEVRVRVTINISDGKVVEAEAISGHQLLRPVTVEAARRAEFYPTRYDGPPAYAKGILVYQFRLPKRR